MKDILTRLKELIIKLMSVKGAAAIIATILMFQGKLDAWWWGVFMLLLIGYRAIEKVAGFWKNLKK